MSGQGDTGATVESAGVSVMEHKAEHGNWHAQIRLEKRHEDLASFLQEHPELMDQDFLQAFDPFEVIEREGNVLVNAGINLALLQIIGGGAGGNYFSNANAAIGVGDGNGSVPTGAAGDTDLTAPTNKLRKGMNATFPTSPPVSQQLAFQASFGTSEANFVWREWGVFNNVAAGTMLNHKGEALGSKSSGTWTLSVTITIA